MEIYSLSCLGLLVFGPANNSMPTLSPPKPHRGYPDLVALLESRGMVIPDKARAERKLAQIGYYRLSGFWYPCRQIKKDAVGQYVIDPASGNPVRDDTFQPGTNFHDILDLYLFDKKLRQLMLDAIERIEIHARSVIAHEMGYHDSLAYQNQSFVNPKTYRAWIDTRGNSRNIWQEWLAKQDAQIERSREDCIVWHRNQAKAIPFWVAVEAWDFGIMSKYFEILNGRYQNRIGARLNIANPRILKCWLQEINTLRNRCAHHTRIWNQSFASPLPFSSDKYFQDLSLTPNALTRMYGMICVLWFLVRQIGPSSRWLNHVADLIDSKPAIDCCPNTAMGFSDNSGFPRGRFKL